MNFLKKCSDAYYNTDNFHIVDKEDEKELATYGIQLAAGTPVTDKLFDEIQKKVKDKDSSVMEVGAKVRGAKINLPVRMGSMDELMEGDLAKWLKDIPYVVSTKLDGCSCLVHYSNGVLDAAYSRGDGLQGQDITSMLKGMKNVPQKLSFDFTGYVRGELILKKSEFLTVLEAFKNEMGKIYKNARNLVAGQVNALEADDIFLKYGHFVTYYIDGFNGTEEQMFSSLQQLGLETAAFWLLHATHLNEESLTSLIIALKEKYDYEIDGVILTQNEVQSGFEGYEANGLNPKKSRKYKVGAKDAPATTIVRNIVWQISKSYLLNPVIQMDEVHLDGVDINFASGHSLSQMESLGVGIGAKVVVSRHGLVIPEVDEVLEPAEIEKENGLPVIYVDCINENDEHESVKAVVSIRENQTKDKDGNEKINKSVYYVGNDPRILREVKIQKLVYFGTTLGVEYMGEGNCRKLVNMFKTLDVKGLLKLPKSTFEDILGVNGGKLYASLQEKMKFCTAPLFYSAVDAVGEASGIGEKKLLALWDQYHTFDLTMEQIVSVNGWAEKTATKLLERMDDIRSWTSFLLENSITFKTTDIEQKSDKFKDYAVCFTGVRDKAMEEVIKTNGGTVLSSVSKKCTLVIAKDPNEHSTKLTKAREMGINVMSYFDAMNIFV